MSLHQRNDALVSLRLWNSRRELLVRVRARELHGELPSKLLELLFSVSREGARLIDVAEVHPHRQRCCLREVAHDDAARGSADGGFAGELVSGRRQNAIGHVLRVFALLLFKPAHGRTAAPARAFTDASEKCAARRRFQSASHTRRWTLSHRT